MTQKEVEDNIMNATENINTYLENYKTAYKDCRNKPINTNPQCKISENGALKTAYDNLNSEIAELNGFITFYKTNYMPRGFDENTSITALMNDYNKILEKRKVLDNKLMELYGDENTSIYNNKPQVDSVVLTGMLWTILATGILYCVLVKI
jgi:hypothetical protein